LARVFASLNCKGSIFARKEDQVSEDREVAQGRAIRKRGLGSGGWIRTSLHPVFGLPLLSHYFH